MTSLPLDGYTSTSLIVALKASFAVAIDSPTDCDSLRGAVIRHGECDADRPHWNRRFDDCRFSGVWGRSKAASVIVTCGFDPRCQTARFRDSGSEHPPT